MRSAVLDTNVVVSALLAPAGAPAAIVDLGFLRQFKWYISDEILVEYQVVLVRQQLGLKQRYVAEFFTDLRETAVVVAPTKKVRECTDANDNKFMECALEARADYVVTGNVRHFPVRFQDIRVVLPRQFLTVLAAEPR
jgi:putative PIN family toxin of toxin-antitoxin system